MHTAPDYRRGTGHVLAVGHDPATCTACAYDAGRRDAAGRQDGRPAYSTLIDPHDTRAHPDLRTWATVDQARIYALGQLDADPYLRAVVIANEDGSDVVEVVRR